MIRRLWPLALLALLVACGDDDFVPVADPSSERALPAGRVVGFTSAEGAHAWRGIPFASAERLGVPYAMHSDAPVTPINPLFTAWCAVTRQTAEGRVLGENERISVARALRAITLGAAYTLRMDHEIGSIEPGKLADFCVLDEDPLEVDIDALKDISVHATVLGGRVLPV